MIEKLHLSTILLVAAVVWGILLILDGVAVSVVWLRPFSVVVGAILLLVTAFDLYLWRLPVLRGWFVKRPFFDGTWRAEVRSTWKSPETGRTIPSISGFMVIRQTFSHLSLRLITTESHSELLGAEVLRAGDGTYRVIGVYLNEPRLSVRHLSPIHYGALVLQVIGTPPVTLEGHYWTDRDTAGEIALSDRRAVHVDDIRSGTNLYAPTRK